MTLPTTVPSLKTYDGNCHCGSFEFSIQIPELVSVIECNCSICFKKGYKWVFPATSGGSFIIQKGDGSLKDYEFGEHTMIHKFCPVCGTGILGQRQGMGIAINARALQGIDFWSLKVTKSDGAAHKPFYVPPMFNGPEPEAKVENSKLYTGSCHCGLVKIALKNKGPLIQQSAPISLSDAVEVIGECDCSICARNEQLGRIITYRPPAQISISTTPETNLSSYSFDSKQFEHMFCPVCGVAVGVNDVIGGMKAVNLRCFDEVEWSGIETYKHRGSAEGSNYVVPGND